MGIGQPDISQIIYGVDTIYRPELLARILPQTPYAYVIQDGPHKSPVYSTMDIGGKALLFEKDSDRRWAYVCGWILAKERLIPTHHDGGKTTTSPYIGRDSPDLPLVASDGLSPYGILKKLPGKGNVTITVLQLVSPEEQGPVRDVLIRNLQTNPSFAVSFARPLEERAENSQKTSS
ncbi:hypothetical protein HYV84_01995 [Candidatus Woesearchaeota archaeon]|nr:hypothetical protein [Candidatus Woesearchaeota archaeon]